MSGSDNGAPGRPTLKRRTPAPDDSTATPSDDTNKPSDQQPSGPPKLKRNDGVPATNPSQPNDKP
jgi:hypothetical protein